MPMPSNTKTLLCMVALSLTLVSSSTAAFAQDPQGGGGESILLSSTTTAFGGAYASVLSTLIASPILTLGGVATTIVAVIKKAEPVALNHYLQENRALATEAVALGGGEGVDDIATLFQVSRSNRAAFAAILVSRREQLLPLIAGEQISPTQALEFARIVTSAMIRHPDLEGDVRNALAGYLVSEAERTRP